MRSTSWIRGLPSRLRGRASRPPQGRPRTRPLLEELEERSLLALGALDPTFNGLGLGGTPGQQTVAFLGTNNSVDVRGMALQPNGKVVVAGTFTFNNGGQDFAVARFTGNGTLDPTFGIGGRVAIDVRGNGSNDHASAVALQPDGKIVVAGSTTVGTGNNDFAIVRLNLDGSLDPSFGVNGVQTVPFNVGPSGSQDDRATAVAIQPDGGIVLGGLAQVNAAGTYDFAVARLAPDGSLDSSFNGGGKQIVSFNLGRGGSATNEDRARAVAIQSDGKIVLAGWANIGTAANTYAFAVARLTPTGILDTTFNASGEQAISFGSVGMDQANALAIQGDGKIVVAGTSVVNSSGNHDFAVARLKTDGTLDAGFNSTGKQTVPFDVPGSSLNDLGNAVTVEADGSILLAGSADTVLGGATAFAVARLTTTGALDAAFNGGGQQGVVFQQNGNAVANAIAEQANGKILVVGTETMPTGTTQMALARLQGPPTVSTAGRFDPATGTWSFRNTNTAGTSDIASFAFGRAGWAPIAGDWNGDGTFTVGIFDPSTATFYLRNSNTAGSPDYTPFRFGSPGWIPLAGDWDGDGKWSIGVFDPSTGTWYLRNEISPGAPDAGNFPYGGANWKPVVGDWDGNGTTTVGVFDPSGNWYLKNSNFSGPPDVGPFQFGAATAAPIAGDWNGDGVSTVGTFDTSGQWNLRNSNSAGGVDIPVFPFGQGTFRPVTGDWNFSTAPQLVLAAAPPSGSPALLSTGQLNAVVTAALTRLREAGVSSAVLATLASVTVEIRDLPAGYLGMSALHGNRILIDDDGAGYGWFVDSTPLRDEEYAGGRAAGGPAAGRADLLTTVLHEMGHIAGLADDNNDGLMGTYLPLGTRRTDALDAIFADGRAG